MGQLNIHAAPLPFSNKRIHVNAPVGSTVQEIVSQICPDKLKAAGVGAIVTINGEIVLQRNWKRIRPKEGTLINVRVVPTGGGGGKNPLATLLSVVVLIAAPYAAAAYGAAVGAALGVSTAIGGALVSAGVGIVGRLLTAALAPPPKPSNVGKVNNPAESPTQFIEGASNQLNPFGVVNINLGINRIVPYQVGRGFTESVGNDQYARQIFGWSIGNKIALSDLKIGETDLAEFDNFEIAHRLNGDLHLGTNIYSSDPSQENFEILLQQVDGYVTRSTGTDADEAIVDFTFPQGLAYFNTQGKRKSFNVKLEMQYALDGVSPLDWTPASTTYKAFSAFAGAVVEDVTTQNTRYNIGGTLYYTGYRRDIVVVDIYTGVVSIVKGTQIHGNPATLTASLPAAAPTPANKVRLANALVLTKRNSSGTNTTTIETFTDDRQAALYGTTFEDSGDFVPSRTGTTINVTSGSLSVNNIDLTASQTEALRHSQRVVFPTRGTYLIRAKRITADNTSDQILDKAYLTAIKTFTYRAPVVQEYANGTALRIKGTDQLNGLVSQLNGIVSSIVPDYDAETDTWIDRVTNNPASLYRFVLQGVGNARPLADDKINITDLEAWHIVCTARGYTYNRNIDYETSVDEVLRDIAAAGAASPAIVDGKRTVVVDNEKADFVQLVTPRNSWNYSGELIFNDLPHAFRVQFRNKDKGYQQDERIVYDDGYNEDNATIFETLELQSCTDADLAYKTARRHIATARLRPETHTFMMDIENLVMLRGDRIKFAHDIPIIGVGDGRVKTVTMDGGSPNLVTGITIDDTVTIPDSGNYYVRVRLQDGTTLYKQLNTTIGSTSTLTFTTPFTRPATADSPAVPLLNTGDLLYVVEAGGELDLLVTRIEPQDNLTARITAVDYAQPAIANAETTSIPTWESNITTPLEFIRPLAPILLTDQSDEDAMLKNSDGSYTPRAIFTLQNRNDGDVSLQVQVRMSGTETFTNANVLESTPERLIITGLQDSTNYDIWLRYKRVGGNMLSTPLQLSNYLFIGAGTDPIAVDNFKVAISDGVAIFQWDANPEIDIAYYTLKYSNVYSGATWASAQQVQEKIYENRITLPFQGGTYLIKAVDILGNDSATATAVITYDPTGIKNVIEVIVEEPAFVGTKDNVEIEGVGIVLDDCDLGSGYYYCDGDVLLGGLFTSYQSASIIANGVFVNDLFDEGDIFALDDVFGAGENDIFAETDFFAMDDVFGIGSDGWSIQLQYRRTLDDSTSPIVWEDWTEFTAGYVEAAGFQYRLLMTSLATDVSPKVTKLQITVDMPDRIERGEDLTCDAVTFATVVYPVAFKNNPAVAITLQNAATDDKIEFISKTASGFSFKVYNTTLAGYVTRTYDYITSGWGREST